MFVLMPIDCPKFPGSIQVRMLQRHLELHGVTSWMHPGPVEKKKYMKDGVEAALKSCKSVLICVDKPYSKVSCFLVQALGSRWRDLN